MRMWMVDPRIMCQKHLCGMHVELHMFVGSIKKNIKMDGFIKNDLLEPLAIKEMHDKVSTEMLNRGYKHQSPLPCDLVECSISNLKDDYLNHKIDKGASLNELIRRCPECNENYCKINQS